MNALATQGIDAAVSWQVTESLHTYKATSYSVSSNCHTWNTMKVKRRRKETRKPYVRSRYTSGQLNQ